MKILLDECVTQAPAQLFIQFLEYVEEVEQAAFSPDYVGAGAKDEGIGEIAAREGWFVITADQDRSKKSSKKRVIDGPPMPRILPALGVTAVYMTSSIARAPTAEKFRALVASWPDMKQFFQDSSPGSKAQLRKSGRSITLHRMDAPHP